MLLEMTKAPNPNGLYEFGPFRVDAVRRTVSRNEQMIGISDKALDLLLVLIEGRDRILDKDELLEKVWPNLVVEQNNLTVAMSALRKTLGEGPLEHRYIVTVPKRGDRFVADIRDLSSDGISKTPSPISAPDPAGSPETPVSDTVALLPATPSLRPLAGAIGLIALCTITLAAVLMLRHHAERTAGSELHAVRSIAVLPFKVVGGTGDHSYLGVGLADALTTRLGTLSRLKVRPTAAVLRYSHAESFNRSAWILVGAWVAAGMVHAQVPASNDTSDSNGNTGSGKWALRDLNGGS